MLTTGQHELIFYMLYFIECSGELYHLGLCFHPLLQIRKWRFGWGGEDLFNHTRNWKRWDSVSVHSLSKVYILSQSTMLIS